MTATDLLRYAIDILNTSAAECVTLSEAADLHANSDDDYHNVSERDIRAAVELANRARTMGGDVYQNAY